MVVLTKRMKTLPAVAHIREYHKLVPSTVILNSQLRCRVFLNVRLIEFFRWRKPSTILSLFVLSRNRENYMIWKFLYRSFADNLKPADILGPSKCEANQGTCLGHLFNNHFIKVDGTSFQVFWICKLWKERTKSQLNVITKLVYDSIAKLVLVQKRQLFCHQLLPWQRYLMIVQTYFWASKAHILKTNLVTPNFFHISFFVIWKWNYMII